MPASRRLLPAGFYYKTFMWPHWHLYEPTIRAMAGLGVAADAPDPDRYDEVSRQAEVLVVGGGAAGAQAALAAARTGSRVLLLEASPYLADADALHAAGVECQTRCTVFGLYDHGLATAVQTVGGCRARAAVEDPRAAHDHRHRCLRAADAVS
jgi:sarcosine oxidase subunit alpha